MWALGCILYELCTLNKPFDASNMPAIIFAIMRNQPQPIPGHFSADMHKMVNALLQPSPADRPSAAEVFALPIVVQHWQRWQATAAHLEGGGAPPSKHGKGGTEVQDPTGSPSVGLVAMRVDTQAASVGAAPPPQTPAAQKAELMASVRALEERMLPELAQARSDAKIHSAPDARAALAARLEDLDSALGQAWGETGNFDKAISAYRTALRSRNANASLTAMEQLGNLLVRRAQQIWAMARAGDVAGAEAATSAFAGVAALGAAAKARERLRAANMADTAASAISSPEQRAARLVRKPKAPTTLLALPEEGAGGEGGSEDDGGPVWKARAAAMMAEGLGVLERLLGFGPTAERYALLGSAYKRRAWTGLGSSRKQDLRAAAEAYKTAHGFEMEMREQDPSYVPSPYARLNQLSFELLSSAKQGGSGRLCRRIQEAQEWAMLRKESDPKDVWLWLQIVDAKCLRWLSGCDGVRQGEVVSDYRLQFSVGTSMRVRSSVLDQVQFMQEVLKGRLSEEEQRRSEHLFKSGLGASGMPSSFPVSPTGAPNITADAWSAAEDMGPGELPLASVSRNVTPASPTESDEAAAV
ncbi:nek3, partial [Symbiodinium sp. KB8]